MRFFILFTLCVAVMMSGCQQQEDRHQPQSALSEKVPAKSQSVSEKSDNNMLALDPAFLSLCPGTPELIAAQVTWDASATGTTGVEIWLQSPGEEKKLWAASGATGSGQTGPWMRAGSTVILLDGRDNTELARIAVGTRSCD